MDQLLWPMLGTSTCAGSEAVGCAQEAMIAEADSLAQTPFGPTMLRAIGRTYRSQAEVALGNFFEGSVAAMRSKGAAFKSQMHAAGLALKVSF